MESGAGKYSPVTDLPFGFSMTPLAMMKVVAVADALGCSIDYLLGRTDRMEIVPKSGTIGELADIVPDSGTIWHPVSEEPPTGVDLVWIDAHGYSDTGVYYGSGNIESVCTIQWPEARWWAELPKEDA
jgi:hypothetical protein